jgi:hypothetical protein
METNAHVVGLEGNRADFSQEAAEFVRSATAIGRDNHRDEDLRVPDLPELTKSAHILEEEPLVLEDTTMTEGLKLGTVL